MNCPYCKCKLKHPLSQCPSCKSVLKIDDLRLTTLENNLLSAFKHKLFLVIAILMTASSIFAILAKGLPIFNILLSIFFWISYSNAKKGFVNRRNLRSISGTIYAEYLMINITAVLMILSGFITSFIISLANPTAEEIIRIIGEKEIFNRLPLNLISGFLINFFSVAFLVLFVILAILILIPNLLWRSKIHNFAKSTYKSLGDDYYPVESIREARNSLFILSSIFLTEHVLFFTSIFKLLSAVCLSGAGILVAILINKYFLQKAQNKE